MVSEGKVRVNGARVSKAAFQVGAADVLTFSKEREVRVVRIAAVGVRRGPAAEARALYEDLSPPQDAPEPAAPKFDGQGRPTKRDRRKLEDARRGALD